MNMQKRWPLFLVSAIVLAGCSPAPLSESAPHPNAVNVAAGQSDSSRRLAGRRTGTKPPVSSMEVKPGTPIPRPRPLPSPSRPPRDADLIGVWKGQVKSKPATSPEGGKIMEGFERRSWGISSSSSSRATSSR